MHRSTIGVIASAALMFAPMAHADDVDNMERDAKAAGVPLTFRTGALAGSLCVTSQMGALFGVDDAQVVADLSKSMDAKQAQALWATVKKNCPKSGG